MTTVTSGTRSETAGSRDGTPTNATRKKKTRRAKESPEGDIRTIPTASTTSFDSMDDRRSVGPKLKDQAKIAPIQAIPVKKKEMKSNNADTSTNEDEKETIQKRRRRVFCCLVLALLLLVAIGVGAWQWWEAENEPEPTAMPSQSPTGMPSQSPSMGPTMLPSQSPSAQPSQAPTNMPSSAPTQISTYLSNIIFENSRFGGDEFTPSSSDTYQQKALDWIVQEGETIVGNSASAGGKLELEELVLQLYALACLYYSTYRVPNSITNSLGGSSSRSNLSGWTTSTGWLENASNGGCGWYGVVCNANGQVEKLSLPNNELSGSIPPELAYLHKSLTYIDLYKNQVHNIGELGNSFLGELTGLKNLYLGDTYFEYKGIPPAIGRLTNLVELDISFNSWFGPLTGSPWQKLTNLEYLAMNGHVFNAELPEELIRLPKLQYLYAVDSFVLGDLEWISKMPQIRELWIDSNPFASKIPSSIGLATTLASFSAASCGLVGTIPTTIGNLSDMMYLWLNNNSLQARIPSEIGKLGNLETLDLTGNSLTGSMPNSVCSLRAPLGPIETLAVDPKVECAGDCCTCCNVSNGSN